MNVKIFENGVQINHIVADEDFARTYCSRHGYTYELEADPPAPPEYTELQLLGQHMTDLELLVMDHISAQTKTEEEIV